MAGAANHASQSSKPQTPMKPVNVNLKKNLPILASLIVAASGALAQDPQRAGQRPPRHRPQPHALQTHSGPAAFGDPLPGLTSAQLAEFTAGLDEFQNVESAETGLGPIFNNVSCVSCHSAPAVGGSSATVVTRFGRIEDGIFDPLENLGGSLMQQFAIDPSVQEFIPHEANVMAQRQSTPIFGLGLIEAIPDEAIKRNAARPAVDGVKGRAAMITDVVSGERRVGRLGWKAQQATLLAFAGDAYLNEIGITNRFFPKENAPNGDAAKLLPFVDPLAGPEDQIDPATGKSDIDVAADFMRFVGPPPALPLTPFAAGGRNVFQQIGCANCHMPVMVTGPNRIAALSMKQVPLYSDLLLHDMGTLGDGIAQADAGTHEFRTAPLWGLRASGPYLHDGRATTVNHAILAHDGEAKNSRNRYIQLSDSQRRQLVAFLNSI